MYGMIHRAVRQMVLDTKGEEAWSSLSRDSGVGPVELIISEVYDDSITLTLIDKVAEYYEMSIEAVLFEFGKYWIAYAETGSFGHILDFTGRDIVSFIANLDRMHRGVQAVMPEARMPSFAIVSTGLGQMVVDYRSERRGLEPFVRGLLFGLISRFGLQGTVSEAEQLSDRFRFTLSYG